MTSAGSLLREVMLSFYVEWRITKFSGKILIKLIGCVGFMPRDWPLPLRPNIPLPKVP